jgi:hypothetical protein
MLGCFDTLYSALATLPALESIDLRLIAPDDEFALTHPESLTKLLRTPSLRSVCFREFDFTRAFCQATADALMEGTAITKLEFTMCSIPSAECAAMIADGLRRNTSVSYIKIHPLDQGIFNSLATALPSNSTLRRLDLNCWDFDDGYEMDLSTVLLALGKNTGIKKLSIDGLGSILDEALCTAMKDGLEMNTTLESLELIRVHLTDESCDLWCRALSFLCTNKSFKSLVISLERNETESCVTTFCTGIAALLQENASLQSLRIRRYDEFKVEEYIELITALQHNMKLKSLFLTNPYSRRHFTDEEDKQMAAVLQKNYALEIINLKNEEGDVGAILRLNAAGRRYLVQDGSSISKGVKLLSAVSNEINCVFMHLLENPRLCDRSAVEETANASAEESRVSTTSPANHNGKREQEQDQALEEGKDSRRRRT